MLHDDGGGAHRSKAVCVLLQLVAAGVAPLAVPPEGAPHRRVVVDQNVLLVSGPRVRLLALQQPPCIAPNIPLTCLDLSLSKKSTQLEACGAPI